MLTVDQCNVYGNKGDTFVSCFGFGWLVQLVEHLAYTERVKGSISVTPANK